MTEQIPVRWIGATWDSSGYAAATRAYVKALMEHQQLNLAMKSVSFETQKVEHAELPLFRPLEQKNINPKIQVIHLTPENYPEFLPHAPYNIGYTVWETDRLPEQWVPLINRLNEVWVPSTWNQTVFKNSGITIPIHVIPHVVAPPDLSQSQYLNVGVDDEVFVFYSIFQWIERKNPMALLKAYLTEFQPEEKVCLVMKSYRLNCSAQEQQVIKQDVARVKDALRLPAYPPINLFGHLMPNGLILSLHERGNCFVLPQRGEGFGIPCAEAMSHGKPVITTGYGGVLEFMNQQNSYLLNYTETPCFGMIFPNYTGKMNWAEPDIGDLKKKMRFVFENREEAKRIGDTARAQILSKLSPLSISTMIMERLRTINEAL